MIIKSLDSVTDLADAVRRRVSRTLDDTRAKLGQFMTPAPIAEFMAGLFRTRRSHVRILDPGAGVGTLTAAVVERLIARKEPPKEITATCYEIDARLFLQLEKTLSACRARCQSRDVRFAFDVRREDYIEARAHAARGLFRSNDEAFDCVVMNPPYRKINSHSDTRLRLRTAGVETSNLYSAFMLLGARQLETQGEFVSISPRSFCNGPYFRPFRRELLRLLSIRHIHGFESRTDAFKDDEVLQENVIVYGVRQGLPCDVEVSVTAAHGRVLRRSVAASRVVGPDDPEAVIHIAADAQGDEVTRRMLRLPGKLETLRLSVSTGRVVDFRARKYLRSERTAATVPLIYPAHFQGGTIKWPNGTTRKPNAIVASDATDDLLVPSGFYVLTKRFSAKEERRRVVAALYDPAHINSERVGFDNKTNYFHARGAGLDERLARGLTLFLNSSTVDTYFRLFSGHTQVNAADLRRLPYPSAEQLRELSTTIPDMGDEAAIDEAVSRLLQSAS